MRIINPQLEQNIKQKKPIKLDLGSGGIRRKGFYGVDCLELENVDMIADLNEPLDLLPDNCVEQVISSHVLEHIHNLVSLLREIYRITKPNGE